MDVIDARFLASATHLSQLPAPAYAELAFAGRSNVGKSSLINSLLGRKKLVRTSSKPGCTRGINLFRVTLRNDAILDLVDLPGYGYAQRSKAERKSWGPLIESFLSQRPGLRGVVLIIDARRGIEADDIELLDYLAHIDRPAYLVATKVDKLPKSKRKALVQKLGRDAGRRVYGYSSVDATGKEALTRALLKAASIGAEEREAPAEGRAEPNAG